MVTRNTLENEPFDHLCLSKYSGRICMLLALVGLILLAACSPVKGATNIQQATPAATLTLLSTHSAVIAAPPPNHPTPTKPHTPSAPVGSMNEMATPPIAPSPTLNLPGLKLKVAYLLDDQENENRSSRANIWVLESPYTEPRQVFHFNGQTGYGGDLAWSHTGNKLAFIKIVNGDYYLCILDVHTLEVTDSPIPAAIDYLHWSKDDRYIGGFDMISGNQYVSMIIDVDNGFSVILPTGAEFVAWSQAQPKQYLYLQHKFQHNSVTGWQEDRAGLVVSEVGRREPVTIVSDLGEYPPLRSFDVAWSPDASFALAIGSDAYLVSHLTKIDLPNQRVETLKTQGRAGQPGFWSPDGEWLAYYSMSPAAKSRIELLQIKQNRPEAELDTWVKADNAVQHGWAGASSYLVVEMDRILFAIDPHHPLAQFELLGFDHLNLPLQPVPVSIEIWLSQN